MTSRAVIFILIVLGLKVKVEKAAIRDLSPMEKLPSLDPLGIIVLLGSVSCAFLALQWAGSSCPWSSSKIIGLMIGDRFWCRLRIGKAGGPSSLEAW